MELQNGRDVNFKFFENYKKGENNMFKKKVISIALAISMAFGMVGCSGSGGESKDSADQAEKQGTEEKGDSEEVELLVYHRMSEMVDFWDDFAEKVNERYPNIHLEQELQKEESTLQVKYASGDDPDILCGPATQQYIDMGKYGDFSDHQEWIDRLDPELISAVTDAKTGGIYRMPLCRGIIGIYYNKDIFEELGLDVALTWDDFVENLRIIKEKKPDINPIYFFSDNYGHHILNWVMEPIQTEYSTLETVKAIAYNDQDVLNFGGENSYVKQYADRLLALEEEGLFDSELAITGTQATANEAFANGETAMLLTGTWWYGNMAKQFPEMTDSIGVAPLPSIVDGNSAFNGIIADSAISYSATNPHQEEIALVLDMLFEELNLKEYSENRGAPSAFSDVESDWAKVSGQIADNLEKYPKSFQLEAPAGFGIADMSMLNQDLIVGTYNAEEYTQEFTNRWNDCFGE